jgi:uncharacterized protein with ATP-grasp and redox domains
MKTQPECFDCLLGQAFAALQLTGIDKDQQTKILKDVFGVFQAADAAATPAAIATLVNKIIQDQTGVVDIYRDYKEQSTQQALQLYPELKKLIEVSDDPLDTAVRLSIAGNIIDVINYDDYDLLKTVERAIQEPLDGSSIEELRTALHSARHVLFLADNAGETVFDRLLIETLAIPVTYAVKGGPMMNDATWEDAKAAGVDQVAKLVTVGEPSIGILPDYFSLEFRELLANAELIISKGQANYETLEELNYSAFFLLQIKCIHVADGSGLPMGRMALIHKQV